MVVVQHDVDEAVSVGMVFDNEADDMRFLCANINLMA